MKSSLLKVLDNLKLRYRFACKKLGIPGYRVHQIYLPHQQLIYIPIPKNACTTIKHALYEIEFGKRFSPRFRDRNGYDDHHDYYKKRKGAFTSVQRLREQQQATIFALVRDPVGRLLSCYRNRVLDLADLQASRSDLQQLDLPVKPGLNTFVLNLEKYQEANKSIAHHSRPQTWYLGGTLDYLDHLYPIEEMESLLQMLQHYKPDLQFLRRKSGGTEVSLADLSPEALESAIMAYSSDYELLRPLYSPSEVRREHQELTARKAAGKK